jgi:cation diffusion facilitator CzcD-associated flavoprotein CzcO
VFDEEMRGILASGHQLVAVLQAAGASVTATQESASREAQLRAELRDAYWAEQAERAERAAVGQG